MRPRRAAPPCEAPRAKAHDASRAVNSLTHRAQRALTPRADAARARRVPVVRLLTTSLSLRRAR
jgi:hypothetical protein